MLSRYPGESVQIETPYGPVWVKVMGLDRNGQVRLAFEAPKRIRILRSELVKEERKVG